MSEIPRHHRDLCSFVEVHTGQILTIPSHWSLMPAYLQARQLHSDSDVDLARLTRGKAARVSW